MEEYHGLRKSPWIAIPRGLTGATWLQLTREKSLACSRKCINISRMLPSQRGRVATLQSVAGTAATPRNQDLALAAIKVQELEKWNRCMDTSKQHKPRGRTLLRKTSFWKRSTSTLTPWSKRAIKSTKTTTHSMIMWPTPWVKTYPNHNRTYQMNKAWIWECPFHLLEASPKTRLIRSSTPFQLRKRQAFREQSTREVLTFINITRGSALKRTRSKGHKNNMEETSSHHTRSNRLKIEREAKVWHLAPVSYLHPMPRIPTMLGLLGVKRRESALVSMAWHPETMREMT